MADEDFDYALQRIVGLISQHRSALPNNSLSVTANITTPPDLVALPDKGLGTSATLIHLETSILPNLAQGHAGPRYYGFQMPN